MRRTSSSSSFSPSLSFLVFWILVATGLGLGMRLGLAAEADDLAKQVNTELRAAQREMFAGQQVAADARLKQVSEQLERLRELDASQANLKALEFFRQDRGWGGGTDRGVEILAVAVRGPWKVAERDLFGRVIRWRLPIHTAVTDRKLRPRNLVRVYDLSIVAQEGAPNNAPQAPPFDGCWVGESWMMRLDKF